MFFIPLKPLFVTRITGFVTWLANFFKKQVTGVIFKNRKPKNISMKAKLLLLIIMNFSILISAFSQTEVSGTISENTTWKKADSPYKLTYNVYIRDGATLTIEDGVTIDLNGNPIYIGYSSTSGTLSATNVNFSNGSGLSFRDGGNGEITGCSFDDVFVNVNDDAGEDIKIKNNTFSNIEIPICLELNNTPEISGNTSENEIIGLSGSTSGDYTLKKYQWDYKLTYNVYIRDGATLTIEDGVTIDLNGNPIYIGYSSTSGTLSATNVNFSNGSGLSFRDGGNGEITGCSFDDVFVNVNDDAGEDIKIKNNTFSNVEIPIYLELNNTPEISGNTSENEIIGLSGSTSGDYTLKKYQWDYKLTYNVYIRDGATLTIEDGVTIDLNGNPIYIGYSSTSGTLSATNVNFSNGSGLSFRDGGNGEITGCSFDDVFVNVNDDAGEDIKIKNNTFSNIEIPICLELNNTPEISGNTSENEIIGLSGSTSGDYTLKKYQWDYKLTYNVYIRDGATLTIEDGVTIDLNGNPIYIGYSSTSGTLSATNVNFSNGSGLSFRDGGNGEITGCSFDDVFVNVNDDAGEDIKIKNNTFSNVEIPIYLDLNNTPEISGNTSENEIIGLEGYTSGDYTLKKYQWDYKLTSNVYIRNGATLTIESGTTIDLNGNPIYIGYSSTSGTLSATNVNFSNGSGLSFRDGGNGEITGCSFDDVYVSVNDDAGENIKINSCDFLDVSYAIDNDADFTIDATNNYWGHSSGPYHETKNPDGQGSEVSDNVDFDPWATEPFSQVETPEISIEILPPFDEVESSLTNGFYDFTPYQNNKLVTEIRLRLIDEDETEVKNVKIEVALDGVPMELMLNNNYVNYDTNNDSIIDQITKDDMYIRFLAVSDTFDSSVESKNLTVNIKSVDGIETDELTASEYISYYFVKDFDLLEDSYQFENLKFSFNDLLNNSKLNQKPLLTLYQQLAIWNGACFGMASTAGAYFLDESKKPLSGTVHSWNSSETTVVSKIISYHYSQIGEEINYENSESYNNLLTQIKNNQPALIGIYDDDIKHAVLCYNITEYKNTGKAAIQIYDSEFPDRAMQATYNYSDETFKYGNENFVFHTFSEDYYDINTVQSIFNEYYNNLITSIKNKFKIFSVACPVTLLVEDSNGMKCGYLADGTLVNNISGSEIYRVATNESEGDSITLIYVPYDEDYTCEINSYESGDLRFEYYNPIDDETVFTAIVDSVEIDNTSILSFDDSDPSILNLDEDGNGETDKEVVTIQNPNLYVHVEDAEELKFNIYPNPANDYVNFRFSNNEIVEISIYDYIGRKVFSQILNDQNSFVWNRKGNNGVYLSNGIFLVKIENETESVIEKLILK